MKVIRLARLWYNAFVRSIYLSDSIPFVGYKYSIIVAFLCGFFASTILTVLLRK